MLFEGPGSAAREEPEERRDNRQEKAVWVGELSALGQRTGNNLRFRELGRTSAEKLPRIKPEISAAFPDDHEVLEELQAACQAYLSGPVFTDDYHQDNSSRRNWEKSLGEASPEAVAYYYKNRLGTNVCGGVIQFLTYIERLAADTPYGAAFSRLAGQIPRAFLERSPSGQLAYDFLDDEDKLGVERQMSRLVEDILTFLEQ